MATEEQKDALKYISDWAKWLIAVQTASTAFIANLLKPDPKASAALPPTAKHAFVFAVICLSIAIAAAGASQSSLPTIVTEITDHEKVWDRGIYFLNRSFGRLWMAVELQFAMFLVGILALGLCAYSLLG